VIGRHQWRAQQSLLRRLGLAGFAFFLIKGLIWLSVPFLIAHFSL
jgi:hypothetical protein